MENSKSLTKEANIELLRKMREIRQLQERFIDIYPTDVMVTPLHLHIGQEAVPVGVCAHLNPSDVLFFTHRSHGPALAKGMDMKVLVAELYGRTTGCAQGYGGSMHLVDPANGMLGSSSIVGGGIPLGLGAALTSQMKNEKWIGVSYFGDGAMDSGVFWESINFAALRQLPVLFVCEDNGLSNVMPKSAHLHLNKVEPVVAEFMPTFTGDGTDVSTVYEVAGQGIELVRSKRAPVFIRFETKRWMKHQGVDWDDLEINPVDIEKDCPIRKLERTMLASGQINQREIDRIVSDIEDQIDAAIEFAVNSPFPDVSDLVREV